jgi:hypothetical protein
MQGLHEFSLVVKENSQKERPAITANIVRKSLEREPDLPTTMHHGPLCSTAFNSERSDELCLMDFWRTKTCFSFAPEYAPFLRDTVTKQASNCDFLMGALLASISLHRAVTDSTNTRTNVLAALQHQNRAITGLKHNLQSLSPANCDEVFLTTVLLMMCAFVTSIMPTMEAKPVADVMIDAAHFLQGAQIVGTQCFAWLFQGRALELFGVWQRKGTTKPDASAVMEKLRELNWRQSSQHDRGVLDVVIGKLEQGFSGAIEEVPWILSVGSEYIERLHGDDLVAGAILMHYGVLLATRADIWWAAYCGRRIVTEMSARLESQGQDYASMTIWCRAHI